jgi:hypothetical protein
LAVLTVGFGKRPEKFRQGQLFPKSRTNDAVFSELTLTWEISQKTDFPKNRVNYQGVAIAFSGMGNHPI